MFITFEGPEGCGKSTQATRLKSYLESQGLSVHLSQEPGGTMVGREIRALLLRPESVLEVNTEVFLFAADRSEHVSKVILPALRDKTIVISDRYIDSTLAYQVGGRRLPEDFVRYVNMTSTQGLMPELTFLLDVSPEVGLQRASLKGKADRFEREEVVFHQAVRQYYLKIAAENPGRIKVVETENRTIDETQTIIREIIDAKLRH